MVRIRYFLVMVVSTVHAMHHDAKENFDLLEISLTKSQSAVDDTPITQEEFRAMICDFRAGELVLKWFFKTYDIAPDDSAAMRNEHWAELAQATKKRKLLPQELAQKRETALSLADLLLRKVNIVYDKVIKKSAKKKPIGINLSALLAKK